MEQQIDGIKPMVNEDNVTVSRNHLKSFIHLPMECIPLLFTAIGSPLQMMISRVGDVDVAGVPHKYCQLISCVKTLFSK